MAYASDPNSLDGHDLLVTPSTVTPNLRHHDEVSAVLEGKAATPATVNNETTVSRPPSLATSSKHKPRFSTVWASLKGDSWLWEVAGCIAAAAGMIATLVLLLCYNDKPLPSWPLGITLGTLISIFATVIHASISAPLSSGLGQLAWIKFRHQSRPLAQIETFDAASRGVVGGLKLLALGAGGFTALLGVFLVLLAFAIGPFVQLALNFQESTGVALLSRCENFIEDLNSSWLSNASNTINIAIQGIMYSDDYDQSSEKNQYVQALNKDCDTGNCKWDAFSSLGYCVDCTNVTKHILTSCGPIFNGYTPCTYALPNGQMVSNGFGSGPSDSSIGNYFSVNYSSPPTLSSSLAYQNWDNGTTLGLFSVLQSAEFSQKYLQDLEDSTDVSATECVFYLCIQGIHSQVINNTLYEIIQPNSFYYTTSEPFNYSVSSLNITSYIILQPPQSLWATLGLDTPTNFTIDSFSWLDLASSFDYVLFDGGTVGWVPDSNSTGALVEMASQNITDWGTFWNNILVSVNAVLRAACPQSDAARGIEQNLGLIVNVRWPWLALPASIVLLTTIFLCLVAIDSHKYGVPVWKTSILAHYANGLPDEIRNSLPQKDAERISNINEWAKTVEVRLELRESSAAEDQAED